jgi:hypothetical protein
MRQHVTQDSDEGVYAYYAGPVSVPARDHCVEISAFITKNLNVGGEAELDTKAVACS